MKLLEIRDLTKTYSVRPPVPVLKGVNLDVEEGQKILVAGRSGAGKSTLLNIIGLLDEPTSGEYVLQGEHVESLPEAKRDKIRGDTLGFVFQDFHVLGHRSVRQNLELKLSISHVPVSDREERINTVLDGVGLKRREHSLARLLSGGEKQRLSLARAIICNPKIILADEPTGNLDSGNARVVLGLLNREAARGVTVIVISHDLRLLRWADRSLELREGVLHEK